MHRRSLRLVCLFLLPVAFGLCGCRPSAQTGSEVASSTPTPPTRPAPDTTVWGLLFLEQGRLTWQPQDALDRHELAGAASPDQAVAAVCPDGTRAALLDGDGTLQLVDLRTGEGQVIGGEKATGGIGGLAWAPDSKRVAYVVEGSVYVAEVGGPAKLVASHADATTLAWSPDGGWIAYGTRDKQDKDRGLFRVSAQGGEPQQLVAPAEKVEDRIFAAAGPAWSPNGRTIAFVHAWEGGTLGFVDADGRNRRSDVDTAWFPLRWLADSSGVVYDNTNPEGGPVGGLAQCAPAGEPNAVASGLMLAWDLSADNRALCVRPLETDPDTQVPTRLQASVVPVGGGEARRLEPAIAGSEAECLWRPDGTALAVVARTADAGGDLWVGEPGTKLTRVGSVGSAHLVAWARAEPGRLRRFDAPRSSPKTP
jgi:hypothetical protein